MVAIRDGVFVGDLVREEFNVEKFSASNELKMMLM
jgi:hypothetical protein